MKILIEDIKNCITYYLEEERITKFLMKYKTALRFYFFHQEECTSYCPTCDYYTLCREQRRKDKVKEGDKLCRVTI